MSESFQQELKLNTTSVCLLINKNMSPKDRKEFVASYARMNTASSLLSNFKS